MQKGQLTREQAIAEVGIDFVEAVEAKDCDFSGRLQTDGDDSVEFCASVRIPDSEERWGCTLVAYYYQDPEDIDGVEDLSDLNWQIAGYEID